MLFFLICLLMMFFILFFFIYNIEVSSHSINEVLGDHNKCLFHEQSFDLIL